MLLIGLILLLLVIAISNNEIINKNINYANETITVGELWQIKIRTTVLILLYSGYLSYNLYYTEIIKSGLGIYNGLFQITVLTQAFDYFIYVLGGILLTILATNKFASKINSKEESNLKSEYALIILFNIIGASLLISSIDIISIYIAIELQSFALYILATLERESKSSAEGGLKYFLLGGLSSCFILLGIALIYNLTGLTNLESINMIYSTYLNINELNNNLLLGYFTFSKFLEIGISLMIIGFLFKIAAAPFHNWAPDVYDGVPTIVTLWLSVMTKISILILLFSLLTYFISPTLLNQDNQVNNINDLYGHPFLIILIISCLLSLIIGTIVGLVQYRIKRLLAYSTISHIGFLLLGLLVFTEESGEAYLFYLIQYSITNANNFFILIAFGYIISLNSKKEMDKYSPIQYLEDLKGQFYVNPLLVLCFTISLFSLAGIPPLIGFFGKQLILLSALNKGYLGISLIAILVSVISAGYYLRIIRLMFFENRLDLTNKLTVTLQKNSNKNISNSESIFYLSNILSFNIALLSLITLLFFWKPYLIFNWTNCLVLTLYLN